MHLKQGISECNNQQTNKQTKLLYGILQLVSNKL